MKQLAYLEYKFMFDPSEAYSSIYEFEYALSEFFRERGFDAQIVKTVDGQVGGRLLLLKKKEVPIITDREEEPKTVKEQVKSL